MTPALLTIGHEFVLALASARAAVEDADLRMVQVYRAATRAGEHLGDAALYRDARRLGSLALRAVREEAYP